MSSLGAFFAAEENRKRRDRICRGKAEAIRKGRKPAGPTPFGYLYDRKTGAWSVDPELGPVVVEIFTRVAQGHTCESIARDLHARGVPRARPSMAGNRAPGVWCLERVHQIVRARTYLGTWVADRAQGLSVSGSKDRERGSVSASRCCAPPGGPTWATSESAHVPPSRDGNLRALRSADWMCVNRELVDGTGEQATFLLRVFAATACESRSRQDLHASDGPIGQARRAALGGNRGGSHSGGPSREGPPRAC